MSQEIIFGKYQNVKWSQLFVVITIITCGTPCFAKKNKKKKKKKKKQKKKKRI